jgi:hypothetical protein
MLAQVMGSRGATFRDNIRNAVSPSRAKGLLTIRGEEVKNANALITLQLSAETLDKKVGGLCIVYRKLRCNFWILWHVRCVIIQLLVLFRFLYLFECHLVILRSHSMDASTEHFRIQICVPPRLTPWTANPLIFVAGHVWLFRSVPALQSRV